MLNNYFFNNFRYSYADIENESCRRESLRRVKFVSEQNVRMMAYVYGLYSFINLEFYLCTIGIDHIANIQLILCLLNFLTFITLLMFPINSIKYYYKYTSIIECHELYVFLNSFYTLCSIYYYFFMMNIVKSTVIDIITVLDLSKVVVLTIVCLKFNTYYEVK